MQAPVDVALLSSGPTLGWRRADEAFAAQVREAGATCALVRVSIGRAGLLKRHPAATDLVEAAAAWHAAAWLPPARDVVISSVTTSFFVRPRQPYAIRFDAPARLNRPGAAGAWQRGIEPHVLARASLLLPWSAEAAAPLQLERSRVIALGVPVERIAAASRRDIDVLAYAGNPHKRGLGLLCSAWEHAGSPGRLVIGGIAAAEGREWLASHGVREPAGVEWAGVAPRQDWLALLGRARAFVNAARFEDHGLAPLEALSGGAVLITVPSPGPYPALAMARALAPDLVAAERSAVALADALRAGLARSEGERRDYAQRADSLLAPHRAQAISRTVADVVLPALGVT